MASDVLIVGGGLCGCTIASILAQRGISFTLVEARARLGGRILTAAVPPANTKSQTTPPPALDLGPSWLWPHQKSLLALIKELDLTGALYEQQHAGDGLIEYANGQFTRAAGAVSMAGSYRLDGGMQTLIDRLDAIIPKASQLLATRVKSLQGIQQGVRATLLSQSGESTSEFETVVLALPPRVVAHTIQLHDILIKDHPACVNSISTWMAGEAKIALVYDTPFWTDSGLSGDAMSQRGPMHEIHDATPRNASIGALFGFVGVAASDRLGNADQIKQRTVAQICRLFNTDKQPLDIHFKDWAYDEFTATGFDRKNQRAHPQSDSLHANHQDQRILWAGTETAKTGQDAGYLEGAVESATRAVATIEKQVLQ